MAEVGEIPGGGRPWGDAFLVQTPALDRFAERQQQQMQQLNMQRQQSAVRESQQLDGLMNKELAKVRSVDIPSVFDAYGKYKSLKQATLFDKRLTSNPRELAKAQMQANAAMGDLQALINKSTQLNDFQKQLVGERKTKFNLFADDFGDKVNTLNNTPIDKLGEDYTNPDFYRYKGANTDFGKMELTAAGQPKPTFEKVERINNLQTRRTPILFGNTPTQFFETFKGNLSQRIPNRDAAAAWENIPDEQKIAVDKQFAAISPDKWKQWGLEDAPNIQASNPNDPAENYAAYRAKLYAINATPKQGRYRDETDQQAKLNMQFNQKSALEAIRQNNRVALKQLSHTFKQMDQEQQGSKLDELVSGMVEDARKSTTKAFYKTEDGKVERRHIIKLSPLLKNQFKFKDDKGHDIYPDQLQMNEDGTEFTPVFYNSEGKEMRGVNKNLSQAMTGPEFKAIIGKALLGVKEASKGGVNIDNSDDDEPSKSAAPTQTKKKIAGW